jgi:hypothetical protein
MRLFARDIKGHIKEWNITLCDDVNSAIIKTGRLQGNLISTIIRHSDIKKEIASRIAKKRKEGYVSFKDLGYKDQIIQKDFVKIFLDTNLPKCNTDDNNNLKPMKCQKFKEGVIRYPAYAQPKLNGLRCVLRWEQWMNGEGIFAQPMEGAKLRGQEGLEYYMPHITNGVKKEDFIFHDIELVYDGELYCHKSKMPLNMIRASCPNYNSRGTLSKPSGDPLEIQFHCFDLAIPDYSQSTRFDLQYASKIYNDQVLYVPHILVTSDAEVLKWRDHWISEGFEGTVIRETDAEYAFGFRPSTIRKCKTHMDSEFLIIDLIPKPTDDTLPLFVLKNDINDETFECNPSGNWDYQRELLKGKENLIGKYATVRYRERTGTNKKLPFHANVIDIRKSK